MYYILYYVISDMKQTKNTENMTTTINNIKYQIIGESELTGVSANGKYTHTLILKRPNGHKEFWAMRNENGNIELI